MGFVRIPFYVGHRLPAATGASVPVCEDAFVYLASCHFKKQILINHDRGRTELSFSSLCTKKVVTESSHYEVTIKEITAQPPPRGARLPGAGEDQCPAHPWVPRSQLEGL